MSALARATASCSSSLPVNLVPVLLVVAVTVAEAVERLDSHLFTVVKRTLQSVPGASVHGPRVAAEACGPRPACTARRQRPCGRAPRPYHRHGA